MRNTELLLTLVADVLYVAAALLVLRISIRYFGAIATSLPGRAVVTISNPFVLPLGVHSVRALYGGVFDADATLTVLALLLGEWSLSRIKRAK